MVKAALLGKIKDAACIDIGEQLFHSDVCGLFFPSTGLIKNSLFVGVLSHESCHSFMFTLRTQ